MKEKKSILSSIFKGLIALAVLIFFAFGFNITKVDFEETKEENRQKQFSRIIRAIFQPDVLAYDIEETENTVDFYTPCPTQENGFDPQKISTEYLDISINCADPNEKILIEGKNLSPKSKTRLYFVTSADVDLPLTVLEMDENGQFSTEVVIPDRPNEQKQAIKLLNEEEVGVPHFSQNAIDTWEKILETVFLAMLATAFGIVIAIPLSLFAARNMMEDITNTVLGIGFSLILAPIGIVLGLRGIRLIKSMVGFFPTDSPFFSIILFAAFVIGSYFLIRNIFERGDKNSIEPVTRRIFNLILAFFTGLLTIGTILLFAIVLRHFENLIITNEKVMLIHFIGSFFGDIAELIDTFIGGITAIVLAFLFSGFGNKLSKLILEKTHNTIQRLIQLVISSIAGFILLSILGAAVDWIYQIENLMFTLWIPASIGGIVGLMLSILISPQKQLPIGMIVFYIARGVFNFLRSIDAVIIVIVFVVWVGIGPFAGVLALTLHTVAALSKLYSEQIESILPGPIEAIKATGANRIQTILYAVVPQIIPPYISFTLYRWDINVRMSTIIGLGGGGGIGFLLMQNINLVNYRQASTQMLAIAIVVSIMDFVSSKLRERIT